MIRRDLLRLNNVMVNLSEGVHKLKFAYFIAKNIGLMKVEIDAINEINKPCEEYNIFEEKRGELIHKYADKNENGDPKIINNRFIFTVENRKKYDLELEPIKEEGKIAHNLEKERNEQFEEMLNEEIEDFKGFKLKFEYLPEEIQPIALEIFMTLDLIKD